MKAFRPNKLSSFLIREKQCKFKNLCNFYSKASFTCANIGGGNYCGNYRVLMEKNRKETPANRILEEPLIAT